MGLYVPKLLTLLQAKLIIEHTLMIMSNWSLIISFDMIKFDFVPMANAVHSEACRMQQIDWIEPTVSFN